MGFSRLSGGPNDDALLWKLTLLLLWSSGSMAIICPHLKNRRLIGNHSISPTVHKLKEDCTSLDYDKACEGFEWTSDPTHYPLFYSKHHMLNLAEAVNQKIITVAKGETCSQANGKLKCKVMFPRDDIDCSNEPTSILGMADNGDLHLWECPGNHTFSHNCLSCINKGRELTQNLIFSDDSVCQLVLPQDLSPRPPPAPRDICAVGKINYRPCEFPVASVEKVHYMLLGLPGVPTYLFDFSIHMVEEGNYREFVCTTPAGKSCSSKNCDAASEGGGHCSGDSVFCGHFNCDILNAECSCQKAPGSGTLKVKTSGQWFTPLCFGVRKTVVVRDSPLPNRPEVRACETCTSECRENDIAIHTDGTKVTSGHLCCSGSCIVKVQEPSTTMMFTRPDACKLNDGDYEILLDDGKTMTTLKKVGFCKAMPSCSISSCFWCWSNWINIHCHDVAKMVMIWVIVCLLLTIAGLLLGYIRVLGSLIKCLWSPILWSFLLIRWISRVLTGRIKSAKRKLDNKITEDQTREMEEAQPKNRPMTEDGYRRIKGVPIYMYIIMCLSISGALGCSENHLLSSDQTICVPSGSKLQCRVRGEALLKAGPQGSEACIRFGPSTSKQRAAIKIKTVGSSLKCRKGGSYWTARYTPKCMSSRRCHLVAECSGSACGGWLAGTVSSEFQHMIDSSKLSENGCIEQCGGIGCGCFNINPSCLFYRNEFQHADQTTYEVFQCAEWIHELTLSVSQLDGPAETFRIIDGEVKQLDWGSLSVAIDGETITASNAFHFIRKGNQIAIVDEEFSDIPRKGFLGEIRCPSEASAATASTTCMKDDGLTRYVGQLDSIRCESKLIDPGSIFERGKLPQSRAGACFTTKPGSQVVEAMTSSPIKVVLKASFDGVQVSFDVDPPKCSASFVNLTGCYSCNPGTKLCLKAAMDQSGATGSLVLKCPSGLETVLNLDSTAMVKCLVTHTDKQSIDEDCTYSCGRDEKKMHVYGVLQYIEPHNDRVYNESTAPIINPKTGSFSWSGWLSGLGSFGGGWIKTILLACLALFLGIVLVMIGIRLLKSLVIMILDTRWKKNN
uniref:Envelopment polyprotein n=1 Tax=Alxa tick phlebovirus TaxID=2977130 RepID=A0A977R7S3_9VIRU|nr:MAG: glycoprotein precursor [Alxa tick phlebovirus]